jgi:hypothetical protein
VAIRTRIQYLRYEFGSGAASYETDSRHARRESKSGSDWIQNLVVDLYGTRYLSRGPKWHFKVFLWFDVLSEGLEAFIEAQKYFIGVLKEIDIF